MGWKRFTGDPVNDLEKQILIDIAEEKAKGWGDLKFIVGSDSQDFGKEIVYVVVLIMWRKGHGARGYYNKYIEKTPWIKMRQRLITETYKAVGIAMWINPVLESVGYQVDEIHPDLNTNPIHKSYEALKEAIGYITGQGFKAVPKPDSWAGSIVADVKTKNRN